MLPLCATMDGNVFADFFPQNTSDRPQVRPTAEGWDQAVTTEGRPLLQFKSPRVKQPPMHLADLTLAERQRR